MDSFKDRVFCAIRDDYRKNRKESFLYNYILENEISASFKKRKSAAEIDAEVRRLATYRLYDNGYPVKGGKSKRKGRNTALSMLDAFVSGNDLFSRAPEEKTDPDAFQILFEQLNDMKNRDAFIPVCVDEVTGIGLYIIGMDHYYDFPSTYISAERRFTCGIGFLTDWQRGVKDHKDITLTLEAIEEIGELTDPVNIREAYSIFENHILKDNAKRYRSYRDINGYWPAKAGLAERFKPYFKTGVRPEDDKYHSLGIITKEDIEKAEKEFSSGFKNRTA